MKISIEKRAKSRISEVDFTKLVFGREFADHMFVTDFEEGKWNNPRIIPYGNFEMSPAATVLHYGQAIFEGMKGYKNEKGEIFLFRPIENLNRLNKSAERLCMAQLPEELFMEGLKQLVKLDEAWIPTAEGCSLYIRPFMFASDAFLGVEPAKKYKFMIINCPVGAYYSKPVRVKIELEYSRACPGGFGGAKAAGNYAGSLLPTKKVVEAGYQQIIWTDSSEHKYIEESGTMNIMFVINGKLITPNPETGTILPGITRKSVIQLVKDKGITVEERKVSIEEVIKAIEDGSLTEAFGVGTAAIITHIAEIGYKGKDYKLPDVENRKLSPALKEEILKIQTGKAADIHNWVVKL